MKKTYIEPQSKFVQTRGADAVADVCWAYGKNNKDFFTTLPDRVMLK